jgi:hypothetical protein
MPGVSLPAPPVDACSLLAPTRVAAVLGLGVGSGEHVIAAVPSTCYVTTPALGIGLNVKKGGSAFQIRVYGFPVEQIKTIEKTLAERR